MGLFMFKKDNKFIKKWNTFLKLNAIFRKTPNNIRKESSEAIATLRKTKNQDTGQDYCSWSRKQCPTTQTMVVQNHKLIYQPVAKNACSSTKYLIAEIGGLKKIKGHGGIHALLDNNNTGLQFKDHSEEKISKILNEAGWMRFIIFRDPLDRLVSAYVEKFVKNRSKPVQRLSTKGVIQAILDKEEPTNEDYDRGITFREFAEYILHEKPYKLDSHWQPQINYLGHVAFTHMYDAKHLEKLEADLSRHIGYDIKMPRANVSRQRSGKLEYLKHAPDLLPSHLEVAPKLDIRSFLDDNLHARLSEYYAADISIYRMVQNINGKISEPS